MEFRRLWTMHFSTFVTVPVTSLLIFAAISPLTGHEFWGLCPFHGATYLCILWCYGRRILNGSACSISLFFSLIGPIVGHLLLGLGAGSSPACCCYFMYLKALNSCFFGWSPIDQHLYLFSQLASTLQWSELDVLSHLAWTQVVLWREKCAPSTHTSHSSPFILYPPIPTSGVLGARGLVCLKSFCMHFLWGQRLKVLK